MDLRQLRTFVAVADAGTVSKAALRLHVAQPALSRQIFELEQQFGIKLFDRIGRRLLLSSEGEQLLGDCRSLLGYAGALQEHAQRLQLGDTGELRVSASPHLIEGIFAGFLHRYAEHFPNVRVTLIDTVGREMLAMLERGDIHLAQSVVPPKERDENPFHSHVLEPMDMLAAFHPDLEFGPEQTIDISRLAQHPLLQISAEFVIRNKFDAACRLAGFKPNIRLESRAPHALLAMAEAGHGIAIIPSALRTHHYRLRIVRLSYRGKPLRELLTVLSLKRRPLPRYAVAFRSLLVDYVREVSPLTRPTDQIQQLGRAHRAAM